MASQSIQSSSTQRSAYFPNQITDSLGQIARDGDMNALRSLGKVSLQEINYQNKGQGGFTALMEAVLGDHVPMVAELLRMGSDVNLPTPQGDTALMYACIRGNSKIVQILLDNQANLNLQTETGYTALMFASIGNHLDIVQMLVDKGARKDLKESCCQRTAADLASARGYNSIAKLLGLS